MKELVIQYLHVLTASIFIGATFFVGLAMIPTLRKNMGDKERGMFLRSLAPRSKILMWTSMVILMVTGFYRVMEAGPFVWQTEYGDWLKRKMFVSLAVVFLMAVHDFVLGSKVARMDPASPGYKSLRRLTVILSQAQFVLLLLALYFAIRMRLFVW